MLRAASIGAALLWGCAGPGQTPAVATPNCEPSKPPPPVASAHVAEPAPPLVEQRIEPPFTTVSTLDLPTHVQWSLEVVSDKGGGDLQNLTPGRDWGASRSWHVADTRAGDVPMPAGSAWQCRYDHARAEQGPNTGTWRRVRCSSDGWRTTVESDAALGTTYRMEGRTVQTGRTEARLSLRDGTRWLHINVVGCAPDDSSGFCATAPELP